MENWIFVFFIFILIFFSILTSWISVNFIKKKDFITKENKYINHEQILKMTIRNFKREINLYRQMEKEFKHKEKIFSELQSKLVLVEEQVLFLTPFRQKCDDLHHELKIQRDINNCQAIELKAAAIRLEDIKLASEEKQKLLVATEQKFVVQFENLANRIFECSSYKIDKQNTLSISKLLIPLREQIDNFYRQIHENFSQEERTICTLSHEIHNLQNVSMTMVQETVNLTQALKGNNKIQGGWGELVLSRVLESSGMREGYEFHTQVHLQQEDGHKLQPDVIVHLPQNKDIIIDSKMSLLAYERYFNSSDELERQAAFTDHISSLRSHIKLLSKKNYQQAANIRTLDYILLFIPIEPAFIIAINEHPELINEAISRNIMLVSPSTLLVALRTINNLWRYEYQNRNVQKIAKRAARLYDKIRLFVDDFNKLGQTLDKVQIHYQLAKKKLFEGNANIVSQAEDFRILGVEVKHSIFTKKEDMVKLDTLDNVDIVTKPN
ncbi:DNA recombination protein RmuC [Blochmannia endosymbiont of Camponotus (Colobopsis) obliquus]|nr:DNA recombination protein RmuC [Blochmannia endosymbiont of Camponotus (Colobopsis) obliquus]